MNIDYIAQSIQKMAGTYGRPTPPLYSWLLLIAASFLAGFATFLLIRYLSILFLERRYQIKGLEKLKLRASLLSSILFFLQTLPTLRFEYGSKLLYNLCNMLWVIHLVVFILTMLLTNQLIDILFTILNKQQQKGYGNQLGILQILKSVAKIGALSFVMILVPRVFLVYDLSKWLASFSIGAGTLTAIAALASKDLISNFFGALVILIGKPFKVGDWIIVNKLEGRVTSIDIRSTQLLTASGTSIYIPNGIFTSKHLENYGYVAAVPIHLTLPILSMSQEVLDSFLQSIQNLIKNNSFLVDKSSRIYLTDITSKTAKMNLNLAFKEINSVNNIKHTRSFLDQVQQIAKEKKIDIQ